MLQHVYLSDLLLFLPLFPQLLLHLRHDVLVSPLHPPSYLLFMVRQGLQELFYNYDGVGDLQPFHLFLGGNLVDGLLPHRRRELVLVFRLDVGEL